MEEESECQLRRRRLSANPKIPTDLEVSFQVDEGDPDLGTPLPGAFKTKRSLSDAMIEFKNKQQSFDIQLLSKEMKRRNKLPSNNRKRNSEHSSPSDFEVMDRSCSQCPRFSPVEECEEEEIIIESDDEEEHSEATGIDRAVTPTPIQDFGANVVYTEGPQFSNLLKVKTSDPECFTDVSDADTEEE